MKAIAFLATAGLLGLGVSSSHAEDLTFDGVAFQQTSVERLGSGAQSPIRQRYAPATETPHRCTMTVMQRFQSTVGSVIQIDKMVVQPVLTVMPLQVVERPSDKYKDDAMSVIVLKNRADGSRYTVILHRATQVAEGVVRDLQIECGGFRYEGLLTKSAAEFERLKDSWVARAFELDPELAVLP